MVIILLLDYWLGPLWLPKKKAWWRISDCRNQNQYRDRSISKTLQNLVFPSRGPSSTKSVLLPQIATSVSGAFILFLCILLQMIFFCVEAYLYRLLIKLTVQSREWTLEPKGRNYGIESTSGKERDRYSKEALERKFAWKKNLSRNY